MRNINVNVAVIFSKNEKIGSTLISWGTKHLSPKSVTPSHGALLIDDRWVIESTLESGVRIISYQKWLEINQLVCYIEYSSSMEYAKIKELYKEIKDKDYDYSGVLYQSYHVMRSRFFKKDIPEVNKWQSKNKYFCLEVIGKLTGLSYEMKTPVELMNDLWQSLDL